MYHVWFRVGSVSDLTPLEIAAKGREERGEMEDGEVDEEEAMNDVGSRQVPIEMDDEVEEVEEIEER